ncbi:MAG TPA: PadR family transcriptional regulator [Anaerolineales bacterium]|nr:PadR family transcriptional regulator [Anaerolineales bacterium]
MPSKEHHIGNVSPEFALLGFLIAGPSHGYDLHQRFTVEMGQVWHLSQSQAYAILKRLETRGDISSEMVEQEKLPSRQMLRVTEAGRRHFFEWLEQGIGRTARSIRLEFLTRLYFTQLHRPENMMQIYIAQSNEIQSIIDRLESLLEHLPSDQVFNHLSLDLRLQQMRLIQNWMAEIRTQFHIPGR